MMLAAQQLVMAITITSTLSKLLKMQTF